MTALTLSRTQAAELCGISPSGFDGWVRRGIVPPPIAGTRRWSRVQLERALAGRPWVPPDQVEEEDPMARWERENPYLAQKQARKRK